MVARDRDPCITRARESDICEIKTHTWWWYLYLESTRSGEIGGQMRWESFDRDLGAVKRSLMRFSDKSLSVPAPHAQSSANLIKVCKLCVCRKCSTMMYER